MRYQSKGNHGGEVNVCQEFQLALAGAPDSSYKSSKKKHTPLLGTLISALIYCFTVFLPCPENAPPWEGLTLAPPRPTPKKISPAPSAIIFSLEGVFAAIAAWIILDQVLGLNNLIGCFFILVGVIISQILPEMKIFKSKQ